jgi:MFS family permease
LQTPGFSDSAVASTARVNAVIAAALALLIGMLSDRLGHKRFSIAGYALAVGGALIQAAATQLWHFWITATLLFVAWYINASMSSALATDILAPERLGHGLPRLNPMD